MSGHCRYHQCVLDSSIRYLAALACGASPDISGLRDVPIDELTDLAARLGLLSLLGDALADSGHPEARRVVVASLVLASRRERLFGLLDRLRENGARGRPIVVKGGGLVSGGFLVHRDMVDLDALVAEADVDSWREAAARVGGEWHPGRGYEAGAITHPDGMIEVHMALPGFVGHEAGPGYMAVATHAIASSSMPDILVPLPQAAREITVQHFVFHHAGETGHALRVLQDLGSLEREPDGEGLDWGRTSVHDATSNLRAIVRQIAAGHLDTSPAGDYLRALAGAIETGAHKTFADDVERWIGDKPGLAAKAGLIVRRIFPPAGQMRESVDESPIRTVLRYLTRPFRLATRFLRTRKPANSAASRWRERIESLKEPERAADDATKGRR